MQGVCDKSCEGCVYLSQINGTVHYCSFFLDTEIRRPCPAGKGCTVKNKKNVISMRRVNSAYAKSYHERLVQQAKDKSQLGQDMAECEKAGCGVRYGAWKATQPVREIVKPEEEGLKECPFCGEKFKPKTKNAKFCCAEHQITAYEQSEKYRARQREYRRQTRARQRAEKEQ